MDPIYKMMRCLGTSSDTITEAGRKIGIAWLDIPHPNREWHFQSLPRDFSLDSTGLLQQFVPELQTLRLPDQYPFQAQLFEIIADFTVIEGFDTIDFGLMIFISPGGQHFTTISISIFFDIITIGNRAGPLFLDPYNPRTFHVHAIVDNSIISVIVNNRTALTVYSEPFDEYSSGIDLFGVDGKIVTCDFDVFKLKPIYSHMIPGNIM